MPDKSLDRLLCWKLRLPLLEGDERGACDSEMDPLTSESCNTGKSVLDIAGEDRLFGGGRD